MMPSAHGQNIMEKQKLANNAAPSFGGESSTFICTECGDGFSQYSSLITHMAIHGPLESFAFDGSSNGFEVPREYVLQENGTLTVVNGFAQSHASMKPASPGILPSHFPSPVKPVSPPLKPQPPPYRDVFKPRQLDLNSDKCRQGHYRCEICSRSFNSLQSLHRHQQYRNTERGYKCTLCCKIFEGRQDLKKHLQDHTRERFYCCDHCGKRFIKEEAFSAHKKESHPKSVGKSENNQERQCEKTYPCRKCKLNFFWMSDYQTHSLYHCKGKESDIAFETEVEIEVSTKDTDDRLVENCHTNGTSVEVKNLNSKAFRNTSSETCNESSSRPYRCGLCGDRFQNLAALKEHHLTHQTQEEIDQLNVESEEPEKPIKRTVPNKGRRRSSNPNGKLHPCKQCHRVFNHSSSLSRHMRYHKGTMHTCVFCGRHFPQRCDVRRHYVMYHKAELDKKPGLKHLYAPPTNGPGSHSVNRKKNKSISDEKEENSSDNEQSSPEDQQKEKQSGKAGRINYKCQECGKRFGLLCVYQRHLRYHKKEPNKCPKCPAEFRNLSSLELHLQNHPEGEADVGQAHGTGASQNLGLEKGNAEDIEDDYTDNIQNDKENSSEVLYECTECTETFSHLETFLQHQTSHGSENNG
ncbi:zinc finger protein 271 [Sphaeramia orbicularis]|uniref:Zinc finger protein 271-like n=1 Tax=Sphaeramia orbicularis TaxID=375764 RepID=A0A673AYU7_9TELE|nr:zinc finger protein 271-like [Sphaeramia orbicularis]XP_030014213.1 zinc finger protein 271-like [Sphaeramia orbicularis]